MKARVRPATTADAPHLGEILWRFQHSREWMPELYTLVECIRYCEVMIDRGWVSVAQAGADIGGFIARDDAEICALYVAQWANGKGMGKLLLDEVKSQRPNLWLRCVKKNRGARRFYRREGFVETARSDGSDTDANLPDITFEWKREASQ